MPQIIVASLSGSQGATIGGQALGSKEMAWPLCASCSTPMQFIAQLPVDTLKVFSRPRAQHLLVFMCQADPGMCDDFAPDSGGNAAFLVDTSALISLVTPAEAPPLPGCSVLEFVESDAVADGEAYSLLVEDDRSILGKVGGRPSWIQGDETPTCSCGQVMTFVAQLEDRGGGGINFGDVGTGYIFGCDACTNQAKFLWQCG
jgi:hypothetical protein